MHVPHASRDGCTHCAVEHSSTGGGYGGACGGACDTNTLLSPPPHHHHPCPPIQNRPRLVASSGALDSLESLCQCEDVASLPVTLYTTLASLCRDVGLVVEVHARGLLRVCTQRFLVSSPRPHMDAKVCMSAFCVSCWWGSGVRVK
jgi:hypothetical protein